MQLRRIVFVLREQVSPILEFHDAREGHISYASSAENAPLVETLKAQLRELDIDLDATRPGKTDWGERLTALAAIAKAKQWHIVLLTEPFDRFARGTSIDWGAVPLVRRCGQVWLDIYETSLLAAVSQSGVFQFAALEDFVFAHGGFEAARLAAPPTFVMSQYCLSQLDMLRPQAALTREEFNGYAKSVLASSIHSNLARVDTIRARAVNNRRARLLAELPKYAASRIRAFEFGSIANGAFGPLVRNPATYEGLPIFDCEPDRWLAHAPDPRSGSAEFFYPYLLLSGDFNLFFNFVERDRRARPLNIKWDMTCCDSGSICNEGSHRIEPGKCARIVAPCSLDGEYTFRLSFGTDPTEPDNYFTSTWVSEARIVASA